jgi:hypothetical protein
MLAAMHPSQMYAISQLRMAADQAQARHDRMVSDAQYVPRRQGLLERVRRAGAPLPAAAPVAAPPKPAS